MRRKNSWTAFLVEVFGHSQTKVFVWLATLIFRYSNALRELTRGFFVGSFNTREEYDFLSNPLVEDSSLLLNLCPRTPSLENFQ